MKNPNSLFFTVLLPILISCKKEVPVKSEQEIFNSLYKNSEVTKLKNKLFNGDIELIIQNDRDSFDYVVKACDTFLLKYWRNGKIDSFKLKEKICFVY